MNWTLIGIGGVLLTLLGVGAYSYQAGKDACENKQEITTLTEAITVKEKQNEIRNRQYTTSDVIVRLQSGNF